MPFDHCCSPPSEYFIERLSNPREQVDMPNTHKWAVVSKSHGFIEAYTSKRQAKACIEELNASGSKKRKS